MTKLQEMKLNLESHLRNPLRDKLRKMSDSELLSEYNENKHLWTKQWDIRYNITLSSMCEQRGLITKSPSIRAL